MHPIMEVCINGGNYLIKASVQEQCMLVVCDAQGLLQLCKFTRANGTNFGFKVTGCSPQVGDGWILFCAGLVAACLNEDWEGCRTLCDTSCRDNAFLRSVSSMQMGSMWR